MNSWVRKLTDKASGEDRSTDDAERAVGAEALVD